MKMTALKKTLGIMAIGITLVTSSILLAGEPQYWVYCLNDKISVEQWDLAQMKVRHGSNVFLLGSFESHSAARDYAERFGGIGASCAKK